MRWKTPIALILAAALLTGCEPRSDTPLLARADGYELTVGEATRMLAGATEVPNHPEVVRALADLWIDYTLLAEAVRSDSALASVDVGPLVEQQVDVETILAMRDSLVRADTTFTAEELRALFQERGPRSEARVRHILLAFPPQVTVAQRDTLLRAAQELRGMLESGEQDFVDLATRISDDRASAREGGDLGWIEEGELVRPLDRAVFQLEPGEVGGPVETPFGIHLVRVDERRVPDFDDARDDFLRQVRQRRRLEADSTFIAGVVDASTFDFADDAVEIVRRLAERPTTTLTPRAARRPLVSYGGGTVTVGELRDALVTEERGYLQQLSGAEDELIRSVILEELARREVLLQEARSGGFRPSAEVVDSLAGIARDRFLAVARQAGLAGIEPEPGETGEEAVERTVEERIRAVLSGARQPTQLGPIAFVLRREMRADLHEPVIARVVDGVATARGPGEGPSSSSPLLPSPSPTPGADTLAAPGG